MNKNSQWNSWKNPWTVGLLIIVGLFWLNWKFDSTSSNAEEEKNYSFSGITTYEEGKQVIDNILERCDKEYQKLCSGARNDSYKLKFSVLGSDASHGIKEDIRVWGDELDYDVQSKLGEYADLKIQQYPHLLHLSKGTCDCW